jgi:hypothetical protein
MVCRSTWNVLAMSRCRSGRTEDVAPPPSLTQPSRVRFPCGEKKVTSTLNDPPSPRPTLRLTVIPGFFHKRTKPLGNKVFHQVRQWLRSDSHHFHGLLGKG